MPPFSPGESALALLKHYEQGPDGGFAPSIYRCSTGHRTIGWGHRLQPSERFPQPFSEADAERLLAADVARVGAQTGLTRN